jgi:predicted metal-dependent hydrolase
VLEDAWRAAPTAERDFWQGLTQLAVGLTHGQRGNQHGCVALLHRGVERLSSYAGQQHYGVDVDRVRAAATSVADTAEREGVAAVAGRSAFRLGDPN